MHCRFITCASNWRCLAKAVLVVLLTTLLTTLLTDVSVHADNTGSVENSLIIGTWGGPYEAAQQAALFTPFEQGSGLNIQTSVYTGGIEVFNEPTTPDILDMLEDEAEVACEAGLLKSIDHATLLQAGSLGTHLYPPASSRDQLFEDKFAKNDFHDGAFSTCSVAHLTFSTLIAYDERAFTGEKPQRIDDLFDIKKFPGNRALQRSPAALFEWAMMAEGVPVSQIYDLLSTERGLRLALKRLDRLKGKIIWWDTPAEAVDLLVNRKVVMASGYNGRFFDAWSGGAPINMIWDGQIIDRSVWAIPSSSTIEKDIAFSFLRFALHPERLAHMARQIPYGPVRTSAFGYIGLHPDTGIVMSDHLPTAEHHMVNALQRDTQWYARTSLLRDAYFSRWIDKQSD